MEYLVGICPVHAAFMPANLITLASACGEKGAVWMTNRDPYRVIEMKGWSYVEGPCESMDGPWRYRWEAEEQAERYRQAEKFNPTLGERTPVSANAENSLCSENGPDT